MMKGFAGVTTLVRRIISGLFPAACVLVFVCAMFPAVQDRTSAGDSPEEDLRLKSMEGLMERASLSGGTSLPSLRAFQQILGMPDESFVADDEYCILGQMHRWCIPEQNLKIIVIGATYDAEIDLAAGSRAIGFRNCRSEQHATFRGPWGIRPGDTDRVVREKLESRFADRGGGIVVQNTETAAIHGFLDGLELKHQYVVKKDGLFFYFMINRMDVLEVILISRIDLLRFC